MIRLACWLGLVKMPPDRFGGFAGDDGGEGFGGGLLDVAQAAEVSEEAASGLGADARDGQQFGVAVAHGAALAMIADGEAVALVADELNEMEDGRAAVEDDGLLLVAVEVDDLFALGDGGEWRAGEAEGFEGLGGGVELAETAVDEDERGEGYVALLKFSPQGLEPPLHLERLRHD